MELIIFMPQIQSSEFPEFLKRLVTIREDLIIQLNFGNDCFCINIRDDLINLLPK